MVKNIWAYVDYLEITGEIGERWGVFYLVMRYEI